MLLRAAVAVLITATACHSHIPAGQGADCDRKNLSSAVSAGTGFAVAGSWDQLGETLKSANVSAISLDFTEAKFPAFAFGYTAAHGGTNIPIRQWDGSNWNQRTERVSQFPQRYNEFQFQVRHYDTFFLGLRINSKFGSVLNGAHDFAGCYAFENKLFEYDIAKNGDMHMLWISKDPNSPSYPGTNNSLVVTTYASSGWNHYPASNAFGKQTVIAKHTDAEPIDDLEFLYNPSNQLLYGAYIKGKKGYVFQGSISAGFNKSTDTLQQASSIAMDVRSLPGGQEFICVATHWESDIRVACKDSIHSAWQDKGLALSKEASMHLPPEISLGEDGTIVVVAGVLSGKHTLAVRKLRQGSTVWEQNDFGSDLDVTHYDMKSNGKVVYLAVSENEGEGLRVLKESE